MSRMLFLLGTDSLDIWIKTLDLKMYCYCSSKSVLYKPLNPFVVLYCTTCITRYPIYKFDGWARVYRWCFLPNAPVAMWYLTTDSQYSTPGTGTGRLWAAVCLMRHCISVKRTSCGKFYTGQAVRAIRHDLHTWYVCLATANNFQMRWLRNKQYRVLLTAILITLS